MVDVLEGEAGRAILGSSAETHPAQPSSLFSHPPTQREHRPLWVSGYVYDDELCPGLAHLGS